MSHPDPGPRRAVFSIGLVAYGLDGPDPSLVFVRVPTERGRWVLTDRCVVEVACYVCGANVGEPCRRGRGQGAFLKHGAGTHCRRREDWQAIKRDRDWRTTPKLRARAEDFIEARGEPTP